MGRKARGAAKEKREPAHKIDGDGMELTADDGQTTGGELAQKADVVVTCTL